MIALIATTITLTVPPAAKVVAAFILIYTITFGLKKIPALTKYITGWVAIAVNILLAVGSLFVPPNGIEASDLWTTNTALALFNAIATALTTSAAAAGIHGTIKSMSAPQVLATIPPSTQVHEVPATLIPDDPKAVAVQPTTKQ